MALRFLADENMPRDAVEALRGMGHDVAWVRTDAPGSIDESVLARAQSEGRVLLTFDKDFGELAFRGRLPASSGIILFRIETPDPSKTVAVILSALTSRSDWSGNFSVVETDRIRMTPLPVAESRPE